MGDPHQGTLFLVGDYLFGYEAYFYGHFACSKKSICNVFLRHSISKSNALVRMFGPRFYVEIREDIKVRGTVR